MKRACWDKKDILRRRPAEHSGVSRLGSQCGMSRVQGMGSGSGNGLLEYPAWLRSLCREHGPESRTV